MNEYASLSEVRDYLLFVTGENQADDNRLGDFLYRASRSIDKFTRRRFYPSRRTFTFDIPRGDVIETHEDLVALKGLSDRSGDRGWDLDALWLGRGSNWNGAIYNTITVSDSSGSTWNYIDTPMRALRVDAELGYHEDRYAAGWLSTGASLAASMASCTPNTASVISIHGASNVQNYVTGNPAFQDRQILRANEEYMYVVEGVSSSQLRVIRAINGTAASTHASNLELETWVPDEDVKFSVIRLAAYDYQRTSNPFGNVIVAPTFGTIEVPDAWPRDVMDRMKRFQRPRIERLF